MNFIKPLIITLSLFLVFLIPAWVKAQTPATTSPTLDAITENIKKRIQEVVNEKNLPPAHITTAYIGTIQSLTSNTLSITTDEGIHLASTSADTIIKHIPGNKTIGLGDLSISGYIAAIGYVQNEDVLTTTEIVAQDAAPQDPLTKSFFGTISTYDPKAYMLSLTNPGTDEQLTVLITRKAALNQWAADGTKTPLKRTQPLPLSTPTLVIYSPTASDSGDFNQALDILLNTPLSAPVPTP